jgi:hypothetical protein
MARWLRFTVKRVFHRPSHVELLHERCGPEPVPAVVAPG